MKYLCILFVAIVAIACNFQVSDTRPPNVANATRTAISALPLPPLPHTLKVWVLPQETAEPSKLPTTTPQPTKGTP